VLLDMHEWVDDYAYRR